MDEIEMSSEQEATARRLVSYHARRMTRTYGWLLQPEDIDSDCWFGVVRALRTHQEGMGCSFSTWCTTCIVSQMQDLVRLKLRERGYVRTKAGMEPRISLTELDAWLKDTEVTHRDVLDEACLTPEQEYLQAERRVVLQRLIEERLTPAEARFARRIVAGMSQTQAVESVGMSCGYGSQLMARVVNKGRAYVGAAQ